MTSLPLRLSAPLYDWEQDAADERVTFDELHQRVIHQQPGGFFAIDVAPSAEGSARDGLFVKFEPSEQLRLVRFSPDGSYFAYLCERNQMGIMETRHPTRQAIPLVFKWTRADLEVLNFFWLPATASTQPSEHADLVVITSQGVEMFRLSYEPHVIKSQKAIPSAVRRCWVEPSSGMVLICVGPRTLQPIDWRAKIPTKLPKFDLVLGKTKSAEVHDVAVMTLYESTFCIHADCTNGRVSLRNISKPEEGTPDHDIVINVVDDGVPGPMRLSKVDNLLIVHCTDRPLSKIFDIRHKEKGAVPSICAPAPIARSTSSVEHVASVDGWDYVGGSVVVDHSKGIVYSLEIDMDVVLTELLARMPNDLATVIRLLLRRMDCRERIVQTLKKALRSKGSFDDLSRGFAVLNQTYRQAIEALSQATPGSGTTVSLQQLEAMLGRESILSEKDMVQRVFYPHFLEDTGLEASDTTGGGGMDSMRIPLPDDPSAADPSDDGSANPQRSPYIVSVVVAYLRSLLSKSILPHKILQCFVFDVCMWFHQEHTLQQLLHYHVLLDSPELVLRLKEVSVRRCCPWATQACLDMALRLREYAVMGDMLIHTRQYLNVVPFLWSHRVVGFPICRLLEEIEADEASRQQDPELMDHVLAEIRMWCREAETDSARVGQPPDLERCGKWLPELSSTAEAKPQAAF